VLAGATTVFAGAGVLLDLPLEFALELDMAASSDD
jgi:hypothetical protein